MKPAWDKLMKAFEGSQDALVADVDCTAAGKSLCADNGVRGYPTIKWGSVGSLEDYQGGRDFDALKKFADENLKPMCGLAHMELCEEEEKAEINKLVEMDIDALKKAIEQKEGEIKAAEVILPLYLIKNILRKHLKKVLPIFKADTKSFKNKRTLLLPRSKMEVLER